MPNPDEDHSDSGHGRSKPHPFEDEVSKLPLMGGFLRAGLRPYDALSGGERCATCGRLRADAIHSPPEPDETPRHWG